MQGEIITIGTDGTISRQATSDVENLDALQAAVGGSIEFVPRFDSFEGRACDAYVNEVGILEGLPENREATRLWWEQLRHGGGTIVEGSRLHGPVALVTGDAEFMAAVQSTEF
ncbi:DUF3846 domain-containing protein [Lichenibacterium minor]|uniref:DUF3846 domain-containing protein n=1 Tax=Lichenibacterium minor TaxID=2316528 RepID=A0A4Q2U153_9HYPH|nr:DUF3846 domain-containing protein [Lichenibacterium minor]RYC29408.1 DUF3846 domain-containing protein [Lichenibacterium minor]